MVFLLPLVRYEARTLNDNRRLETEKKKMNMNQLVLGI